MRALFSGLKKKLLVRGWVGHSGVLLGTVAVLALVFASPLAARPPGAGAATPGIAVVVEGRAERWIVDLGGVLVAALSPEQPAGDDGLLLLVRPARFAAGPRRLLRLRLEPEGRLETVAEGLSGAIDTLAAVDFGPGAGPHLVAGGPGRLLDLGALAALSPTERSLAVAADFDLRSLGLGVVRRGVERRLAALAPGHLRIWEPASRDDSGAAGRARAVAVPFAVVRSVNGLRVSSPAVASLSTVDPLYLAGPEAVGSTRLRCVRIDASPAGAAPIELWAALPGPETVAQSWPFEIDGVPVLVVRTQAADELNLFERQRLRVLPLAADRTRAGALPTLAVELDSKRWHTTAVALGDVDDDGHEDLLAAFPEGLSGSDLVVEWWRGRGGGRFESRAHRSDIAKAPAGWVLVPESGASGRPGLLLVGNGRMELRLFAASGRGALGDAPALATSLPRLAVPRAPKQVTLTVGPEGERTSVKNEEPEATPLGAVELDRRPDHELLAVQPKGDGSEQLILLRARPE